MTGFCANVGMAGERRFGNYVGPAVEHGLAVYAYSHNYLTHLKYAVIMEVEATTASCAARRAIRWVFERRK